MIEFVISNSPTKLNQIMSVLFPFPVEVTLYVSSRSIVSYR